MWDKARPKLVEKTGIGKAIEKALKVCPVGHDMERNVRDALESLVELRPTDSGYADAELKRMAGNTYRVVGTSVGG